MHYSSQKFQFYYYIIFLSSVRVWAGQLSITPPPPPPPNTFNLTHFKMYREKRSLIYEGGGTLKFVVGPTLPVQLRDPITWRSLICSINLHGGHYTLPTTPLYPWDKYENIFARSMRKIRFDGNHANLEASAASQYWTDDSRLFVYSILERFLHRDRIAGGGRVCLLRSICENAQVQQHIGIFAEILNIILTPGKEDIDEALTAAYNAGKSGVDCLKLYNDCPMGSNILDEYIEFL